MEKCRCTQQLLEAKCLANYTRWLRFHLMNTDRKVTKYKMYIYFI
jgi:hypothetical protein